MKRIILLLGFFMLITVGFATTLSFNFNLVCKNDNKLILKKIQLTDDATIVSFSYTNDQAKNKTIGVFPPTSANSMFLYNQDGTKIYRLRDIKELPKWWPQKKYVLNKDEKLEFQLIFEKIDPTLKINIVEGKNNFKSTTGWIFLDVAVNSYDFLEKKIIELLQNENLSENDQVIIDSYREYEFVNDFISYFKNKNDDIKKIYLTKWRNNPKAGYFVNFILNEEMKKILANNELDKALKLIENYPNTMVANKTKEQIKPLIENKIRNHYDSIKDSNSPKEYISFINKYSKYKKDFPDITYIDDIQNRLESFIKIKKNELLTQNDPIAYNNFFKKYDTQGILKPIYDDYEKMAKQEYTNVELENTPNIWFSFLQKFPYTTYAPIIHQKFYEYFKKNPNNIDLITKYVGEYPKSPYLQKIIALIPKATTSQDTTAENSQTTQIQISPQKMTLEEKIQAFKNSIKKDALLHYREKTTVSNPSVESGKERYVVIYEVKILNVLNKTVRVEIINATLTDPNPSQKVLSGFKDLKEVMIGTIEKREFQKFDEFKSN